MISAAALFAASAPRSRHAHWQQSADRGQLLVTNGSRLYDVGRDVLDQLDAAARVGDSTVEQLLRDYGLVAADFVDDTPVQSPPLHALSLAVAQKCNLGCTYCYAGQGDFGGAGRGTCHWRPRARGRAARGSRPHRAKRVNLAFLGGEPLVNRPVLRAATEYAARLAATRGVRVSFSITTNGTLLTEDDAEFFERHGFAVTVSLDGLRTATIASARSRTAAAASTGSWTASRRSSRTQQRMQVSARVTVTPANLAPARDASTTFSRSDSTASASRRCCARRPARGEMDRPISTSMLESMIACGLEFERRVALGERYAFANMVNAMREIAPRHASALPMRRRRRLSRRLRRRRSGRLPPLRRRRARRNGRPSPRHRSRAAATAGWPSATSIARSRVAAAGRAICAAAAATTR